MNHQNRGGSTDVEIGSKCSLKLPNGETMIVCFEYLRDSQAGIRIKGWKRMFVPLSLLTPTSETKLTLPSWWRGFRTYNDIVAFFGKDSALLVE